MSLASHTQCPVGYHTSHWGQVKGKQGLALGKLVLVV